MGNTELHNITFIIFQVMQSIEADGISLSLNLRVFSVFVFFLPIRE